MAWKSHLEIIFLILLGVARNVRSQCTSEIPTVVEPIVAKVVVPNIISVLICNDGKRFETGDSAIAVYCVDNEWETTSAVCGTEAADCATAAVEDDYPTGSTFTLIDNLAFVGKLECSGEKKWLSGEPVRIMQCREPGWSTVLDICDDECPLPKDCLDVQNLGFTSSDEYLIVPSQKVSDTPLKVYCELSGGEDTFGGGWTVIMKNDASAPMTDDATKYDYGHKWSDTVRFAGFSNVHHITHDETGNPIPHVLEILLTAGTNDVYQAIYSNFTVASATHMYALQSIGKYHGNAGDGLCPHVYTTFAKDSDNIGWWGDSASRMDIVTYEKGSLLTSDTILWGPLEGVTITSAKMRIRPSSFDSQHVCPPEIGYEPSWEDQTTEATFGFRNATSIVTYQCIKPLFYSASEEYGNVVSGTVECVDENGVLKWNDTIELPCQLTCPDNFLKNENEDRCYHFSEETATGIHQANTACIEIGASLAKIVDESDTNSIADTEAETFYWTVHVHDGTNIEPGIPVTANCSEPGCEVGGEESCATFRKDGKYAPKNCRTEELKYMCMIPAYCPEGFHLGGGGCYQVLPDATLKVAEASCNLLGGSLARPTSNAVLNHMNEALMNDTNTYTVGSPYLIGLNSMKSSWTSGDLYVDVTDAEVTGLPDAASEPHYYSWMFNSAEEHELTPLEWEGTATGAICQWNLFKDCVESGVAPLANMTNTTAPDNTMGTMSEYECDKGYFPSANISHPVVQTVECRGPLGQWQPELVPCIRTEVCIDKVPIVTNEAMTNITDEDSLFLTGNITYLCPTGMGLIDGAINQTLTCVEDTPDPPTFKYDPEFANCTVCLGDMEFQNATATFAVHEYTDEATNTVEVTCNASYEHSYENNTQKILCTSNGWEMTGLMPCKKACMDVLPPVGIDMVAANITERWVGTEVIYSCTDGFKIPGNATLPIVPMATITCMESGEWVSNRVEMDCYKLCEGDPPGIGVASLNTTWKGDGSDSIIPDAIVEYFCADGLLLGNRTDRAESKCVNGTWTEIDSAVLTCTKSCTDAPPAAITDATFTWDSVPFFEGETFNYSCPAGQGTKTGKIQTTLKCIDGAYVPSDPEYNITALEDEFVCVDACPGPPVAPPLLATSNYTNDFTEGTVVSYFCEGFFTDGNQSFINVCENKNWTMQDIPHCSKYDRHRG